jgi:hypothetical protein
VENAPTWRALLDFYVPLALTSFIVLGGGPLLSFGLGNARDPLVALAVWPVVMGMVFLCRSAAFAYQEVVIALLDRPGARPVLRRFAWLLALALTAMPALFALPSVGGVWLERVAGLRGDLAGAALPALALVAPVPGLSVFISWYRGVLVHAGATDRVTRAVALNLATLASTLGLVLALAPRALPGALLAATALTLSLAAETLALARYTRIVEARSARPADTSTPTALERPAEGGL